MDEYQDTHAPETTDTMGRILALEFLVKRLLVDLPAADFAEIAAAGGDGSATVQFKETGFLTDAITRHLDHYLKWAASRRND